MDKITTFLSDMQEFCNGNSEHAATQSICNALAGARMSERHTLGMAPSTAQNSMAATCGSEASNLAPASNTSSPGLYTFSHNTLVHLQNAV